MGALDILVPLPPAASRVPAVGPPAGSAGWAMGNWVRGKSGEGAPRQGRAY